MPPKKQPVSQSNAKSQNKTPDFKGFVNVVLTELQKKEHAVFWEKNDVWDVLLKTIEMGYKVTLKYDDYQSTHTCFLMATDDTHVNAGWILSIRGDSPWKALMRTLYVHLVVFEGNWHRLERAANDDGW